MDETPDEELFPIERTRSLNKINRTKDLQDINKENQRFLKILQNKKSRYSVKKWDKDWKKMTGYIKNICESDPQLITSAREHIKNPLMETRFNDDSFEKERIDAFIRTKKVAKKRMNHTMRQTQQRSIAHVPEGGAEDAMNVSPTERPAQHGKTHNGSFTGKKKTKLPKIKKYRVFSESPTRKMGDKGEIGHEQASPMNVMQSDR